ncbi:MAG: MerR family transcriptional regulator [Desulfobacterales bacterium]|nr:MerR family transcriptional regulator [Desulfobacterales bacterium]
MKIGELIKLTGVSKESIHYYMREGVLQKPRKTGKNTADYSQAHVDQIRTIKALRENYYLPIPVIKKLIRKHKKQSHPEKSSFQFLIEKFKPLDQLLSGEGVTGKEAFKDATGLSQKWLSRMEEWGILAPEEKDGDVFYSADNVIIGKLLVEMDRTGIGPRDGFDPKELANFTALFRDLVAKNLKRFMQAGWDKMTSDELRRKGSQSTELMSLFFYHMYRKLVKEEYKLYLAAHESENTTGQ